MNSNIKDKLHDVGKLSYSSKSIDYGVSDADLTQQLIQDKSQTQLLSDDGIDFLSDNFTDITDLGKGGNSQIFKATHNLDKFVYAIKIVSIPSVSEETTNECRLLAKLKHSNVVNYNFSWLQNSSIHWLKSESSVEESSSDKTNGDSKAYTIDSRNECYERKNAENNLPSYMCLDSGINNEESSSEKTNGDSKAYTNDSRNECNERKKAYMDNEHEIVRFLYIQMEFCDNDLKKWLENRNDSFVTFDRDHLKIANSLARQLLSGIQYIHNSKVIHRDIKPANIFILTQSDNTLRLKIGDFGLSKCFNAEVICVEMSANVGTSIYMAPEVHSKFKYSQYDHKCDLYSIGVVLTEIMSKFKTVSELIHTIKSMRETGCNDYLVLTWPEEAPHILNLLSTSPDKRPSAEQLYNDSKLFEDL